MYDDRCDVSYNFLIFFFFCMILFWRKTFKREERSVKSDSHVDTNFPSLLSLKALIWDQDNLSTSEITLIVTKVIHFPWIIKTPVINWCNINMLLLHSGLPLAIVVSRATLFIYWARFRKTFYFCFLKLRDTPDFFLLPYAGYSLQANLWIP